MRFAKVLFVGLLIVAAIAGNAFCWELTLEHDSNGVPTFGTVDALINAVQQGADVKVRYHGVQADGVIRAIGVVQVCDRLTYNPGTTGKSAVSCFCFGVSAKSGTAGIEFYDNQESFTTNGEHLIVNSASSGLPLDVKRGIMSWYIDR
jgi:hypothetical protein